MAGAVPVVPRFRFNDALGNPLALGSVTVYLAGTTTLANTYQNKGLTVANTNPVTLDANGECLFWVDEASEYKFLVKDSLGSTVTGWPVDNIQVNSASGTFTASGTGAVARTMQAKAREWVSVKDFGAVGDGVTDDTAAILAGIAASPGALFFPKGVYRTTAEILVSSNGPALFGLNGRFIGGNHSTIYLDHTGTGVRLENQTGLGGGLFDLLVERAAAHAASGINIAYDSNGAGPSTIVSHCDIDGVTSYRGQTGLAMRGLIFSRVGRLNILNATTGMSFPGAGSSGYNPVNVATFDQVSIQACTTALAFESDAGTNLHFKNLDIESCTDTISIAAGCSVANVTFDTVWLEDNTNGMKLRAGSHIKFKTIRHNNAAGINLFDSATFGAKNVEVETVIASANDFAVGTANASVANVEIIANGGWASTVGNVSRSYTNGALYTPAVSAIQVAGSAVMDVMRQSGRISKNYLVDWDIIASGNWGRTSASALATATDPLGGNTAYTFSGTVVGGCNAMPVVANGQQKEMVVWAYGSGRVKLQNWGRTFYWDINTTHWVRLPFRVLIEDATAQAMDSFNLTLTQASAASLRIWRPGVYEGFDSIDSRPGSAAGIYQGGYLDFTTYPAAINEGTKVIVHASAMPSTGFFMAGDIAVNSAAPTKDGNNMVLEGWTRLTNGNLHVLNTDWVRRYVSTVSPAT